jgi:hypothetical protein
MPGEGPEAFESGGFDMAVGEDHLKEPGSFPPGDTLMGF